MELILIFMILAFCFIKFIIATYDAEKAFKDLADAFEKLEK